MDYQKIIDEIYDEVISTIEEGEVAKYIPELAQISPNRFGLSLCDLDGNIFGTGDFKQNFSIQSITKLFVLTMAIKSGYSNIWNRMGREPSGNAFNSLVQLEYEYGKPRNPFINAGALVAVDIVLSTYKDPINEYLNFVRELAQNSNINFDDSVAESEKTTGHRNKALANFIKSFNNLENSVDDVLDAYFKFCSLSMSCEDLSKAIIFLANSGDCLNKKNIVSKSNAKYINSILLTCGTYDAVGDFAYRVGLPAKSGVGGGIVAIMPGKFGICVWSPRLNKSGNSFTGTNALELFTTKTGISIF